MDIDDDRDGFARFFRVIVEPQRDLHKLALPIKFTTEYGNDLLDVVSLKTLTGKTWIVELVNENGRTWIGDGWHELVKYYSICRDHFLVFSYTGMSWFNVFIFDTSTCEIQYPYDPRETRDPNIATDTQMIKVHPCSASSSAKDNGMAVLVGKYRRNVRTITRQHIKEINSYQFETPSFTIRMQKSYVTYDFRCNVPMMFATEYMLENQTRTTLQTGTGDRWTIACERSTKYVRLSRGWRKFALDNKLKVGDICVFELLDINHQFSVQIIRC